MSAVAVLLLLIAGIWIFFKPAAFNHVEVTHPVRGPAIQAVYATGSVEASVMLPLAARNTARLTNLYVDEGTEVKKDQVLAQLEDDDLQRTLDQLQAQERFAKTEYDRNAAMVKNGIASRTAFDQARSNWESAKAATAKARTEAGFMKLVAPADGRVIRRDGEIGQMIAANDPIFWMTCCAPLRISAEVDEEDIVDVKPGLAVLIRADAFPGKIFHGVVQSITPKGDPISRSYRVRITFTEEVPLQIGMTSETNIIVHENKDALLIPASALVKNKVWVIAEDGTLAERNVTVGTRGTEQIEIREGLNNTDQIVVKPNPKMKAGRKVRITMSDKNT